MNSTPQQLVVESRRHDVLVRALTRRIPTLAARIVIRLHRRLVRGRLAVVDISTGVRMAVSPQDNLGHHLFYFGAYEPVQRALWERLLARGEELIVLDVGANMGYYSLLAAARRNVAKVVCFEPNPMVTPILRYNVQANSGLAGKVTIVEAAAGDADGIVPFHRNRAEHNFGLGSLRSRTDDEVTVDVPMVRLDRHLPGMNLQRVDLVKIDVEGAELAVLTGLLGFGRPTLVIEVHPHILPSFGAKFADIAEALRQAGYRAQRLREDGTLTTVEDLNDVAWVLAEPA
jgi:FkbM family methyltransferase